MPVGEEQHVKDEPTQEDLAAQVAQATATVELHQQQQAIGHLEAPISSRRP